MRLEDQVCSLEHAKKLKELGVPQNSLFYWVPIPNDTWGNYDLEFVGNIATGSYGSDNAVSALTDAELGELLPEFILDEEKNKLYLTLSKLTGSWECCYWCDAEEVVLPGGRGVCGRTEVDALTKMLIWLIENGYLDLKGVRNEAVYVAGITLSTEG